MNAQRRAAIEAIRAKLNDLNNDLESIKDSEQEAFDNMPESLQQGDRGQKSEASIDNLDSALSSINDTLDYLNEATE